MAPKPKKEITQATPTTTTNDNSEDFASELIKQINKEAGEQIAYNLGDGTAPTDVKRWISTGSVLLDYAVANRRNGGLPEGRIIEIQGPPSSGKSHIAFEIAKLRELAQRPAIVGLVKFGELSANDGLRVSQGMSQVGQGGGNALLALEQHDSARKRADPRDHGGPFGAITREEAEEGERNPSEPTRRERGDDRGGAGDRDDVVPRGGGRLLVRLAQEALHGLGGACALWDGHGHHHRPFGSA